MLSLFAENQQIYHSFLSFAERGNVMLHLAAPSLIFRVGKVVTDCGHLNVCAKS